MGITQRDIAHRLGLSVTAVSQSLRDMPDISAETKKLVRETAMQMGYRKNMAASHLRTNASRVLGVVVTNFSNPAMSSICRGAEAAARAAGYTLMFASTFDEKSGEEAAVSSLLDHGVDGLLLVPALLDDSSLQEIEQSETPYTLVLRTFDRSACSSVTSNDSYGAQLLARHLLGLGHRRVLCIPAPAHLAPFGLRCSSFAEEFLRGSGGEGRLEYLRCCTSCDETATTLGQWLQEVRPEDMPTAVVAFTDYIAFGAYLALREHGVSLPDDVSLVGFDDNLFCELPSPALTMVSVHYREIGFRAIERLLEQIAAPGTEPQQIVDTPELIIRGSTGAAKK